MMNSCRGASEFKMCQSHGSNILGFFSKEMTKVTLLTLLALGEATANILKNIFSSFLLPPSSS